MVAVPFAPSTLAVTQSPTAGQSAPSSAARRSLPAASAQHSPNSPAMAQNFFCCEITRAGTTLPRSVLFHMASKYPFQPQFNKPTEMPSAAATQHTATVGANSDVCFGEFLRQRELRPIQERPRRHTRSPSLEQWSAKAPPKRKSALRAIAECGSANLSHSNWDSSIEKAQQAI